MKLVLKSSSQSKIRRRPGAFTAGIPKTATPKRHLRPSLPQHAGTRVILTLLLPIILSSAKAQQYTGDGIPSRIEEEIRWLVNRGRFDSGAENAAQGTSYSDIPATSSALAPNQQLRLASRHHSEDMAKNNAFQHETVTGSAYYNAVSQPSPWDRWEAEGYGGNGGENIAAGYPGAHEAYVGWWKSTGHRVNMYQAGHREIGNGHFEWASSTWRNYYTMALASSGNLSFLTGTLFNDDNGNGRYEPSEAAAGITVRLTVEDIPYPQYDVSTTVGSFAIPIQSIPAGARVEVILSSTANREIALTIPTAYSAYSRLNLPPGQGITYGGFTRSAGVHNVGLREIIPFSGLAISPAARSIPATGGNGTFTVSSNTNWSWSSSAAWLTSNESTSQSGNQTFSYSMAPIPSQGGFPPAQSRTATITITAGTVTRTHTVTQSGAGESLAISPTTRSIGAGGGNLSFTVSSDTTWSWSDNATWLTSNESSSQSSNQTFSYSVEPNTSTQERTATITITAGNLTRTHTVTQEGAVITDDHGNNQATATRINENSTASGSIGTPGDLDYFHLEVDTEGSLTLETEGQTDTYGTLLDAGGNILSRNDDTNGRNFLISRQVPAGIYYVQVRHYSPSGTGSYQLRTSFTPGGTLSLSPETANIPPNGGDDTFSVSSNTTWSWSDNAAWLTSNESTSQSGNQTFSYSVAPNTSTQERTATITITAGTVTRNHTVTQSGAGASLAISPTTRSIGAGGGDGTFAVSSNTTWSWSDNAAWLTSNESTSQSSNQIFSYSVAPNTSTQERTATITITAGTVTRTHTVTQSGAGEILAVSPTTRSIGAGGGNGTFSVSSNTTWSWSDNAAWLTSNESTSQSGNQTFSYSVAPNPSTEERSATITITAGTVTRTHTVTQMGLGFSLADFTNFNFSSGDFSQWTVNGRSLTSAMLQVVDDTQAENGKAAFVKEWAYGVQVRTPPFVPSEGDLAVARYYNPNGISSCGFFVYPFGGDGIKLDEVGDRSYVIKTYDLTPWAGQEIEVGFAGGQMQIDYLKIGGQDLPAVAGVTPEQATASALGGELSLAVSSNTNWSWSSSAAWLTSNESTSQNGNQTFSYSVAPNPSTEERTATITITAGTVTRTHTVTQSGAAEILAVSPTTRSIGAGGGDVELIPLESIWSYSDEDGDLGTAWRTGLEVDDDWLTGAGPLGYGSVKESGVIPIAIATEVNNQARQPMTYFRKEFEIDDASAYLELTMKLRADAGPIVYLNGVKAFQDTNIPEGATYGTLPTSDSSDSNEGDLDEYTLDPALLVTGTNIIAVEHFNSPTSSDMVFDIQLDGRRTNGTFSVSSITNWSWSSSAAWLTSNESTSQNGNQTFSYSVAPNPSTEERSATISITAGNLTRTHTVTQSGVGSSLTDFSLDLSKPSLDSNVWKTYSPTIHGHTGSHQIVQGDRLELSNAEWLYLADPPNSVASVEGSFTLRDSRDIMWVTLNSSGDPSLSPNMGPYDGVQVQMGRDVGGLSIAITGPNAKNLSTAPFSFSVGSTYNFLIVDDGQNLSVKINGNEVASADYRSEPGFIDGGSNVVIQNREGWPGPHTAYIYSYKISSSAQNALTPAQATTDALGEELTFEVEVAEGVEWSAESFADWLTITEGASGTGPGTVTYTVSRNSSTEEREAQIQVAIEGDTQASASTLEDGLVAYYPFNGNANDESGNGNNGTVNGATLTTDRNGDTERAYDFDGTDDFIKALDSETLRSGSITLSSWVYSENNNRNVVVISKITDVSPADLGDPNQPASHSYRIRLNGELPFWEINTNNPWSQLSGSEILRGQWELLTVTWDGQTQKIYRNGQLDSVNENAADGNIKHLPGADLMIGRGWHPSEDFFEGQIDDIRIYDRVLSDTEVTTLYDLEKAQITLTHTVTQEGDTDTPIFDLNVSTSRLASGAIERVTVSFPTSITAVYSIEGSADMRTWVTLEAGINGNDHIIERSYPVVGAMRYHGFYRIRRE